MGKSETKKEAKSKDHRELGQILDLFSFHEVAPGAPFWHPKGMIIFKELERFIRAELDQAGYEEIATPILVKKELFEQSGHWEHYRENMFWFKNPSDEKEMLALKPMNCPESTFVYRSKIRSYKDLPLRFSEIGRLHRNERSGTLGGLFRVRQITMDDAHIYCRPDQIQEEIKSLLKLFKKFYSMFGFKIEYQLSTKPDKALGEAKIWKKAETALELALKSEKIKFKNKPKEGAFYGPKIDIDIKDSLGRSWQLATIQLDLVMLPKQFDVYYIDENGKQQKPIVIHRAILGSFERFIGILLEHFNGALPLWLSPIQAVVLNVGAEQRTYAKKIYELLKSHNIRAELSIDNETVGKRIREAELQKIPYILVVGEKEVEKRTINVRHRDRPLALETPLEEFLEKVNKEIAERMNFKQANRILYNIG